MRFIALKIKVMLFMGNTQWACVEIATGRPKRMSPTFTQAYQPLAARCESAWILVPMIY